MSFVERRGEAVARRLTDRRGFLHRAAGSAFGVLTAWTVLGPRMPKALGAIDNCFRTRPECGCIACAGQYCNTIDSSYCTGSTCSGGCSYYGGCGYPTSPGFGCWCTRNCCYNDGAYSGYYECCDCQCPPGNQTKCSCRQFVFTCRASSMVPAPGQRCC